MRLNAALQRIVSSATLALALLTLHQPAHAWGGYLSGHEVDFRGVLPGPPVVDSLWDRADQGLVEAYQSVDATRFQMADLDQNELYPRFAEAFGRPIDKKTSPVLVALLNRAIEDVDSTASDAKDYFHRPRPFQRLQLQRVCEKSQAQKPEDQPTHGTSYPSGHSTHGWTVAMILARVAPERSAALMARAQLYQESRLVCGMHFPSDVEAGHEVAIAVVSHLDAAPEFQNDLAKARKEHTDTSH
jgi:acid phosphatase (class A)